MLEREIAPETDCFHFMDPNFMDPNYHHTAEMLVDIKSAREN